MRLHIYKDIRKILNELNIKSNIVNPLSRYLERMLRVENYHSIMEEITNENRKSLA